MSGHIITGMSNDEDSYKQMVAKVKRSGQSSNIGSMCESRAGPSMNATQQHSNATLTSQQFCQRGPNTKGNFHMAIDRPSEYASSIRCDSVYPPSDANTFKMPQTVKHYNVWSHYGETVDCLMMQVRQIEDKHYMKLLIRILQKYVHRYFFDKRAQPTDPEADLDYIYNGIKNKYLSGRVCRSITSFSSTITNERIPVGDFYGNNPMQSNQTEISNSQCSSQRVMYANKPFQSNRSVFLDSNMPFQSNPTEQLDRLNFIELLQGNNPVQFNFTEQFERLKSMPSFQPNVVVNDLMGPHQRNINSKNKRYGNVNTTATTTQSKGKERMPLSHKQPSELPVVMDHSSLSLFNESLIAQRRDESAVKQPESSTQSSFTKPQASGKVKGTPVPKNSRTKVKRSSTENSRAAETTEVFERNSQEINNDKSSAVAGKGTTRAGRTIKTPRQYWKGNESNLNDTSNNVKNPRKKEICLDDSMTLRNKKVVDKKKSPPSINSREKNTPLTTIFENENLPDFKKPEPSKKTKTNTDKENLSVQEKKPTKKQNKSVTKKDTSSKQAKKDVVVKTGSKQKSETKVEGDDYLKHTDDSAAYVCPCCTRTYKHPASLYKHRKYECGKEAQFNCPYCDYRAKLKNNLWRHFSLKH